MSAKELETPTNVQLTNPYIGNDRGLFKLRDSERYARIHAANWVSYGPTAAQGFLSYQIMAYDFKPVTQQDFNGGTILPGSNGDWRECLTRAQVSTPIIAEYWAIEDYYAHPETPGTVDAEARATLRQIAEKFVETMAAWAGLVSVETNFSFLAQAGLPMSQISADIKVVYTADGVNKTANIIPPATETFDPVRLALAEVERLKQA